MRFLRLLYRLTPRFVAAWGVSFAALIGVASALMELAPSVRNLPHLTTALLVVASVVATAYAAHGLTPSHLPTEELLPSELNSDAPLALECTTARVAVEQVHELTRDVYPGVEPLPIERYEQWLMLNPHIFVCLFDRSRAVRAYFDVFPLRDDFMRLLIEGRVGEQDIRSEHILRPSEARSCGQLYLGGIAVSDWHKYEGRRHAAITVWGLLRYLEHHYPPTQQRFLFAHAVTAQGESLLKRLGCELVATATGRRDPYPLYRADLSIQSRDLVRKNLADYSGLAKLSWVTDSQVLPFRKGRVA